MDKYFYQEEIKKKKEFETERIIKEMKASNEDDPDKILEQLWKIE